MLESWMENKLIDRKPQKAISAKHRRRVNKGHYVAWNVSVIVSVGRQLNMFHSAQKHDDLCSEDLQLQEGISTWGERMTCPS